MPVINRIASFQAEMASWRQDFHQHPELAFEEHRTAELVAKRLESFGNVAATGCLGFERHGRGPVSGKEPPSYAAQLPTPTADPCNKPGFTGWIGPAGPKATETLAKLPVPS